MTRIAFFADSFHEVNGVALTSRQFAGFAQRQRFPFFSVHAGPQTRYWREDQMETFEVENSRFVLGLEKDLSFDLLFYRHRAEIRRRLLAFAPDVIHVTGPSHLGILGVILAHDLKVPLAASWHTNLHEFAAQRLHPKLAWLGKGAQDPLTNFTQDQTLALTLRYYQLARLLFAPNPELVQMLMARTGRPAHLMERGIDISLFSPNRRTRATRRDEDEDFVIGFVGRLSPEKSVRELVDFERGLQERGIRNCRFLVVGDGSERQWLSQNLQRAELPGVLSGEALAQAYANMDAFVFPSRTDTYGNVILEAMASGVPAVVSNGGGPKFLVESGKNGYVADGMGAFVDALAHLWSHSSLRQQMSASARQAAMRRSWDGVFEKVYARYGDILAEGTSAARQGNPSRVPAAVN